MAMGTSTEAISASSWSPGPADELLGLHEGSWAFLVDGHGERLEGTLRRPWTLNRS